MNKSSQINKASIKKIFTEIKRQKPTTLQEFRRVLRQAFRKAKVAPTQKDIDTFFKKIGPNLLDMASCFMYALTVAQSYVPEEKRLECRDAIEKAMKTGPPKATILGVF